MIIACTSTSHWIQSAWHLLRKSNRHSWLTLEQNCWLNVLLIGQKCVSWLSWAFLKDFIMERIMNNWIYLFLPLFLLKVLPLRVPLSPPSFLPVSPTCANIRDCSLHCLQIMLRPIVFIGSLVTSLYSAHHNALPICPSQSSSTCKVEKFIAVVYSCLSNFVGRMFLLRPFRRIKKRQFF